MNKYTPEFIDHLEPDEIIVVGTNSRGLHGGGLARYAQEHFGLKEGEYSGHYGQCYCIMTLDSHLEKMNLNLIREQLEKLSKFAMDNPDKIIYLTKIGCGIAGFKIEEIKSILPKFPKNVILPIELTNY